MQIGMDHFTSLLQHPKLEEKWGYTPSHTKEAINKPKIFIGKVQLKYLIDSSSRVNIPYLYFKPIDCVIDYKKIWPFAKRLHFKPFRTK